MRHKRLETNARKDVKSRARCIPGATPHRSCAYMANTQREEGYFEKLNFTDSEFTLNIYLGTRIRTPWNSQIDGETWSVAEEPELSRRYVANFSGKHFPILAVWIFKSQTAACCFFYSRCLRSTHSYVIRANNETGENSLGNQGCGGLILQNFQLSLRDGSAAKD